MTTLEKVSHFSVIAVSCVALGLLIEHRLVVAPASAISERSLTGRSLDFPTALWQTAPVTLVLHLSSTCSFCAESTPFYKRLLSARSSSSTPVRVVVATADSVDVMQKYLAANNLVVDDVLHTDRGVAENHGTPIVLAVDPTGKIRRAFVGKLDAKRENEVLSIVERGKV